MLCGFYSMWYVLIEVMRQWLSPLFASSWFQMEMCLCFYLSRPLSGAEMAMSGLQLCEIAHMRELSLGESILTRIESLSDRNEMWVVSKSVLFSRRCRFYWRYPLPHIRYTALSSATQCLRFKGALLSSANSVSTSKRELNTSPFRLLHFVDALLYITTKQRRLFRKPDGATLSRA